MLRMMNYSHPPTSSIDHRGRRERGFTLLEIMVVVMLVGLLVAIGFPMMRRSLVRAEMMGQVKMIEQALTVARMHAIKSSQWVCIKLLLGTETPPQGKIIAWVDTNQNRRQNASEEVVGEWTLNTKTSIVKEGGTRRLRDLRDNYKGVIFLPTGTAVATKVAVPGVGRGSVIVEDRFGNQIRINIHSGTGTVVEEMYDHDADAWSDEIRFWQY